MCVILKNKRLTLITCYKTTTVCIYFSPDLRSIAFSFPNIFGTVQYEGFINIRVVTKEFQFSKYGCSDLMSTNDETLGQSRTNQPCLTLQLALLLPNHWDGMYPLMHIHIFKVPGNWSSRNATFDVDQLFESMTVWMNM